MIVNRNWYDLQSLIHRVVTALILLWYDTLYFLYRRNPVLYVIVKSLHANRWCRKT